MKTGVERSAGGVNGRGEAICTVSGHAVVGVGSGNVSWRVLKRKEGRTSVVWSIAKGTRHLVVSTTPTSFNIGPDR